MLSCRGNTRVAGWGAPGRGEQGFCTRMGGAPVSSPTAPRTRAGAQTSAFRWEAGRLSWGGGGGTTSPRARATDPEPAAPDRCPRPHPQRRPVCRPHPHTGNFLSALRSPPYEQTIAAHQKPREVPYVENRPKPTGWRVGVLRGRERTGREQDCRDEKLKLNKSVTNIFRDVRSSLYP